VALSCLNRLLFTHKVRRARRRDGTDHRRRISNRRRASASVECRTAGPFIFFNAAWSRCTRARRTDVRGTAAPWIFGAGRRKSTILQSGGAMTLALSHRARNAPAASGRRTRTRFYSDNYRDANRHRRRGARSSTLGLDLKPIRFACWRRVGRCAWSSNSRA